MRVQGVRDMAIKYGLIIFYVLFKSLPGKQMFDQLNTWHVFIATGSHSGKPGIMFTLSVPLHRLQTAFRCFIKHCIQKYLQKSWRQRLRMPPRGKGSINWIQGLWPQGVTQASLVTCLPPFHNGKKNFSPDIFGCRHLFDIYFWELGLIN
jgi:hypothetical protein